MLFVGVCCLSVCGVVQVVVVVGGEPNLSETRFPCACARISGS